MALQTNEIKRQSTINIADIEAWLDEHPDRKAENLTGVINVAPIKFVPYAGLNKKKAMAHAKKVRKLIKQGNAVSNGAKLRRATRSK